MKEIVEHKDKLGQVLTVGSCVTYPLHNTLMIGIVKKIHPKMVGVSPIRAKYIHQVKNKYPQDLIKLEGPNITMYLLKESGGNS